MARKTLTVISLGLAAVFGGTLLIGSIRWQAATRSIHTRLEAARRPLTPPSYDAQQLAALPAPVQRYFRAVLTDGQPMIAAAEIEHSGTFNMSETGEQWRPFTSTQRVVTSRPGFDWEGRVAMLPGLKVRVHDAYIAGEGVLHASLFGLVSVVDMRGTPEMARGELMRFLAETAWYPTALLPSQGVRWEAVDDTSARATLKDGATTVTLRFRFNDEGLAESVDAEARGRTLAGAIVQTPWRGRWSDYRRHDGMLVPTEGEVAWMLPEGPRPYWRGRIEAIRYEFAR